MWTWTDVLETLLRGAALGVLTATLIPLARSGPGLSIRVSGALMCVAISGYVLISSPITREAFGGLDGVFRAVSWGGVGAIWAFALALFDDRPASPVLFTPYAALSVFGFAVSSVPQTLESSFWIAHNLAETGLAVHILYVVVRSWRGDLVETRRCLRGPFVAAVALFAVTISAFEIGESFGVEAEWYSLAGAAGLAIFCIAGALVVLELRLALFGAAVPANPLPADAAGPDAADQMEIARLNSLMFEDEAWRREALSIGALAVELKLPEHRLRRLINDRLGHRNFAAFVKSHRIEAAKRRLSDPAEARTTISSIAFDLGFGSLGPFNRAFREATGQTPTEWRRQAMTSDGPDPSAGIDGS